MVRLKHRGNLRGPSERWEDGIKDRDLGQPLIAVVQVLSFQDLALTLRETDAGGKVSRAFGIHSYSWHLIAEC